VVIVLCGIVFVFFVFYIISVIRKKRAPEARDSLLTEGEAIGRESIQTPAPTTGYRPPTAEERESDS
jgi:hypothetical protein